MTLHDYWSKRSFIVVRWKEIPEGLEFKFAKSYGGGGIGQRAGKWRIFLDGDKECDLNPWSVGNIASEFPHGKVVRLSERALSNPQDLGRTVVVLVHNVTI